MVAMLLPLLVSAAAISCRGHGVAVRRAGPSVLHLRGEALASADLQVGTEPGKANVVSGFELVGTWESGDDLAAVVPATSPVTNFYLRATEGTLQLSRAIVEPPETPFLQAYLDGDLVKQLREEGQVNLRPDEERLLALVYDCRSQGDATLTLTLEFEGLSPVLIPLKKTCGGEKNTALTLTVGTANEGEKVVVLGEPKWDELKVVGVRPTSTAFTLYVDPLSEKGAQVISTPSATGIGACSARVAPENLGMFSSGSKNLAAGESVDVAVEYRCFRHGNCIVSAKVPFYPDMAPYQPLRWSWTKLCGGEALGIDVEVPAQGKQTRRLLATDGAANSSTTQWIAETELNEHKIRLVNDKMRSLESEVKVRSLTVRCLDTKRCTARLADTIPKAISGDSPLDLNVQYQCHSTGSSIVQLMLATDGHDPVVVTWAKDCSAFGDSLLGVILIMICTCGCFACAAVGLVKMCFDGPAGKGRPLLEGEFAEDENLTQEEIAALDHYEEFYGLQKGAASIEQVKDSVLGVAGWSTKGTLDETTRRALDDTHGSA